MKRKMIYLFLIATLGFIKTSSAQMDLQGFDDGVRLGFADAKRELSFHGEFQCTWVLNNSGLTYTVSSCGVQSFTWYGGGTGGFTTWYGIYTSALNGPFPPETLNYYLSRYQGQKLGANLAYSQALSGGGFIDPF